MSSRPTWLTLAWVIPIVFPGCLGSLLYLDDFGKLPSWFPTGFLDGSQWIIAVLIAWLLSLVAGPIYISWDASRAANLKRRFTWSPISIAICALGAQVLLALTLLLLVRATWLKLID